MAEIYKSAAGKEAVESLYRRALQRWPVPHRQLVVPTKQGDTFVIVSGESSAAPLVLFHGSGTNSSVWIRAVAEWSQHYRVHAIDMIGEPGFSAPSRPPLASDAYAAWLDEVWSGLRLGAASVVGVSLGAWLALDYAIRRPAHVASLSMVSPSGIGRQNHLTLIKAGVLLMFGSWGLGKSLKMITGNTDVPRETREYLVTVFRHFRPRMERIPIRTDAELAGLSMPVQLILGGNDALLWSRETRDRMERLVPRLQLTYLENEGHFLPRQTKTITEFLTACDRQPA